MKHLAYLNKFFWKYRFRLLLGVLFVGLANYFRVWQPQVMQEALDTVFSEVKYYKEHGGIAAHPEAYEALSRKIGIFGLQLIGLALAMGAFMFFMRQTLIVMSRLIEYDMRKEIFAHYEKLDFAFYKRNSTGDLMSRISEDVNKVRMYAGPSILYALDLLFLFVLTINAMLKVSVTLTLWSLLPLPFLSISIYFVSRLINKRSEKIQAQLSVLTSSAHEVYSGIRVVKSYTQEKAMGDWFAEQSEVYRQKSLRLVQVDAVWFPIMALMVGASTIITVYVGGLLVADGTISAGNIAQFVIYVNMLTWPVTAIGWITSLTQQAAASQKRINEFLQVEPTITAPSEAKNRTQATSLFGQITFENVTFVYPDTGILALENVSFDIKAGEKWAIVGKTGCGKTTIADLIVRMYDVTSGRILIDGKDIKTYDPAFLRQHIGYVPQDVFLFSDTVFSNIAFGKSDISEQEAIESAKNAAIHDEVLALPKGYETIVGERGVTLSGGQKQRISIARAFAKKPDLVLLDDCLSAVDTQTEALISEHLTNSLAEKTAVIITHRLYSSLQFDKILVMEDHKVAQIGSPEEVFYEV